ncbi:helix-turn-helix protein [Kineococcus xinjiangensis]|uniref:Helix-turn-helix protein n=1 Tax=Kineococcus xinjiangensis TaxID=512762 RepID=A0A2S6IT40_9ACTN|nr:helix-turn-helix transcriptional regulator [Kineococcus xinjiangensis]PPK97424.1 helix-turn-helix protein [Kineococcus xinjiangensis]
MSAEELGAAAPFLAQLGQQVRDRRRAADLTVQQLADRAGVSRRMLTQVELGQANPSMVTVDKLARALGVDFPTLAGAAAGGASALHRPPGPVTAWASPAGSAALLHVAGSRTAAPELWEWNLAPGDAYASEPDPAGSEELLLVLAGTLLLEVDGAREDLPAGTAARLTSDRAYAYRNDGGETVRFVRVTVPPR